jgi:hypothetical protein
VLDLAALEMGPFICGGTSRLPPHFDLYNKLQSDEIKMTYRVHRCLGSRVLGTLTIREYATVNVLSLSSVFNIVFELYWYRVSSNDPKCMTYS